MQRLDPKDPEHNLACFMLLSEKTGDYLKMYTLDKTSYFHRLPVLGEGEEMFCVFGTHERVGCYVVIAAPKVVVPT